MADNASADAQYGEARVFEQKAQANGKESWAKPEIVDYQPVTVARGVQWRIGDGINNLS